MRSEADGGGIVDSCIHSSRPPRPAGSTRRVVHMLPCVLPCASSGTWAVRPPRPVSSNVPVQGSTTVRTAAHHVPSHVTPAVLQVLLQYATPFREQYVPVHCTLTPWYCPLYIRYLGSTPAPSCEQYAPVQGSTTVRTTAPEWANGFETRFTDGYPFLLATEVSCWAG